MNITFKTSENLNWIKQNAIRLGWQFNCLPEESDGTYKEVEPGVFVPNKIQPISHNWIIDIDNKTISEYKTSLSLDERINMSFQIFEDDMTENQKRILNILLV